MPGHRTFPSCRNFVIPKEYQGCIIGKEGSIVKDIQITTATTINIKDHKDPKKCTVRITGTSNGTRAAEKRVRQVMEEHIEHAERQEETLKLNTWKKCLGLNSHGNILLKVCGKFSRGKCDLTEVRIRTGKICVFEWSQIQQCDFTVHKGS